MDFNGRYSDSFYRVCYRYAGVRVCRRVENYAVNMVKIRFLYRVHKVALVI